MGLFYVDIVIGEIHGFRVWLHIFKIFCAIFLSGSLQNRQNFGRHTKIYALVCKKGVMMRNFCGIDCENCIWYYLIGFYGIR